LLALFKTFFATNQKILLTALLLLVGSYLVLTIAFSFKSSFTVKVGELGDAPFVSGFYGDEAGTPRFRWTSASNANPTQADGIVILPLVFNTPAQLKITFGGPSASVFKTLNASLPVTITVNGVNIGQAQLDSETLKTFSYALTADTLATSNPKIEIKSPVLSVAGDSRKLGVRVTQVELSGAAAGRSPDWETLKWAWLYLFALSLVALRFFRQKPFLIAGLSLLSLGVGLGLPFVLPNLWYTPYLLPVVAQIIALLALLVWLAKLGNILWGLLTRLENPTSQLARNLLIVASLLYFGFGLAIVLQMDYIGHADYADNGVVARNLLRGHGFAVDYAAQFYQFYPQLPHPADTWPILQPLLTVPFFLLFGPTAFAAKLPNLLLLLGLAWVIFYYASRYFNRLTGLGAACLILSAPVFFETVASPINDLSFTVLLALLIFSFYTALHPQPSEFDTGQTHGQSPSDAHTGTTESKSTQEKNDSLKSQNFRTKLQQLAVSKRHWILSGVWGGLLLLSKPSAAIILLALGLAALGLKFWNWQHQLQRKRQRESQQRYIKNISWVNLFLWGILTLLVASPYFGRNLLDFGKPVYSTENYDVWVNKWNQNDEAIYNLYYLQQQPLPGPNLLLSYGYDSDFKEIGLQFSHQLSDLWQGLYEAPLLLILAGLGLAVLPRRRYGLALLVGWVLLLYELFINIYWHYELRYFLAWRPWFYMFGLYGLSWIYVKIKADFSGKSRSLRVWLLAVAFLLLAWPNLNQMFNDGVADTSPTGIVITASWIQANTPSNAVIMSRNVWELSFHAERRSVMIPNNAKLTQVEQVMHDYGAQYLQLDHLDTGAQIWQQRRELWPLIHRESVPHFTKIYDQNGFLVYLWDGQIVG
jgi:4-amino-4-deoxy-L-arabinose transferase-like glycosyltransferase